jgi:hypothetical protein
MHRSSETIAALASALAKAQSELINPEKSLVATVRTERLREPERSFRYASLASGLEIIRKTLGQHEIATVQATAVDQNSGTVTLTTVLAHASGEWISSDWPVCQLTDLATPRRMGAALTYARRYALFTLVGIAGEDDLDAPDLHDGPDQGSPPLIGQSSPRIARAEGQLNGHRPQQPNRRHPHPPKPSLEPEQSSALRNQLLAEVTDLESGESAANWARRIIPIKNSLTAEDARLVEAAFEQKMSLLSQGDGALAPPLPIADANAIDAGPTGAGRSTDAHTRQAREDVTVLPKRRRQRDKAHLKFVSQQACLVCGRRPSDAHHLRFAEPRALGRKVSDEFTVPLCRGHHRALHRSGKETLWWAGMGIEPIEVAAELWNHTRRDEHGPWTWSKDRTDSSGAESIRSEI